MSRAAAERQGRKAERLAAWWLRLKGYRILGRRVRCPRGEIDLIVRRCGTLVFVEVKQRASAESADWALTPHRVARVAGAAQALAPRYARTGDDIRIDAIFIVPGRWPRHVENVWHG